MAYVCELGAGQRVYLDNQGTQTVVTLASSSPGQQQQATTSVQTGSWIGPPQAFQAASGVVIKIQLPEADRFIQIQGSSISLVNAGAIETAQPLAMQQAEMPMMPSMEPMQPMQPMQPMTMGNMSMSLNPMEMRMGDMEMRMRSETSSASSNQGTNQATNQASTDAATNKRFCNQCGSAVKPADRFCSSCGNRLE
jgi:hypothetical protein